METQIPVPTQVPENTVTTNTAVAAQPPVQSSQPVQEDLLTRVAKFKPEEVKQTEQTEDKFDFKEIEAIKDPIAKEQALKAYKSFQRGFNDKFQELSSARKQFEEAKNKDQQWTPERINELLKDPQFLNAAKVVAGATTQNPPESGLTDQEYSMLSDKEKTELSNLKSQVSKLEQVNYQAFKMQQDSELKNKYPNYDPQSIDKLTTDLVQGRVQATREHLYKVLNYDEAVRAAYALGLQDRQMQTQEKISSVSFEGNNAVINQEVPEKISKENDKEYFKRLVMNRMQKNGNIRK